MENKKSASRMLPANTSTGVKLPVRLAGYSAHPRLRDLKNTTPIAQALLQCYNLVGLRPENFPSKTEAAYLENYAIDRFPLMIAQEIVEAFRMAVGRELKEFTDSSQGYDDWVNCYQKFSPEYFARIIDAYKQWKQAEFRKTQPVADQIDAPQVNEVPMWEGLLFVPFDEFCKTGEYPFDEVQGANLFGWLKDLGFVLCRDKKEMQKYLQLARAQTKKRVRKSASEPGETQDDYEYRIRRNAKALILQDRLTHHRVFQTDLRKMVTERISGSRTRT
jgi:hypothetical protein